MSIRNWYEDLVTSTEARVFLILESWPEDDLEETVETTIADEPLSLDDSLRVLLAVDVLPTSRSVDSLTMSPTYKAGIRKAAEVCLINEVLQRLKEARE